MAPLPLGMAFAAGWTPCIGAAFVTGAWMHLFQPLQRRLARFGWPPV